MPTRRSKSYRFVPPTSLPVVTLDNFREGQNTNSPITDSKIRLMKNLVANVGSGFQTRKGTQKYGSAVSASASGSGIFSYVKKDRTAQLLASAGTTINYYTDSPSSSVIATSTNSQATGYSKDRHVFMTSAHTDATSGLPFVVVLYQSGAGIILEWEDTPYNSWGNTPITVSASTQLGFSAVMDSSDNIYVAYMSTANVVQYVKLTYGSGPTWSVGTAVTVAGTGASDSAALPSIAISDTNVIYVAYRYYNGTNYTCRVAASPNSGTSWNQTLNGSASQDLVTAQSGSGIYPALLSYGTSPQLVTQVNTTGTTFVYTQYSYPETGARWVTIGTMATDTNGTTGVFSVVMSGSSVILQRKTTASSTGITLTSYGQIATSNRRVFDVVNDGVNDNDIQYRNIINGSEDTTSTRVTSTANNNLYPTSPLTVAQNAQSVPVVFVEGTGSPYNIRINGLVNWVSTGTTITTGTKVNGCLMPLTAAGGTNQFYFVNGVDAARKWDGTTMTAATATGYPVPTFIFAMDGRLLMDDATTKSLYYTTLGSDDFTGTYTTTNRIDFPEAVNWGHWYRDSVAFIFTDSAVYALNNFDYTGESVGPESIRRIPDSYGTLAGRTVKQVGYWVYYQRPDGQVMRTNGNYAELVSNTIFPDLAMLSATRLREAAAGTIGNYYLLSISGAAEGTNLTRYRLDTRVAPKGGWSIETGFTASCYTNHPTSSGQPLLFAMNDVSGSAQVYQHETGTTDTAIAIPWQLKTGALPLSGIFYPDRLRSVMVLPSSTTSETISVGYSKLSNIDSYSTQSYSIDPAAPIWGQFTWGSFTWGGTDFTEIVIQGVDIIDRAFSVSVSGSATHSVSIDSISLNYEKVPGII